MENMNNVTENTIVNMPFSLPEVQVKKAVKMYPNKKTKDMVNAYQSNKEWGWIQLEQITEVNNGLSAYENRVTCNFRGPVKNLNEMYKKALANKLELAGNICIKHILESELTDALRKAFFNETLSEEENLIELSHKTAKLEEGGVELTQNGERILVLKYWDASGTRSDEKLQYDNVAEASESRAYLRAQRKNAKAAATASITGTAAEPAAATE